MILMKRILLIACLALIIFGGCTKDGTADSFKTNTGIGGSMARFTIVGNYLYTVDKSNLKVYNIADAADPVLQSTTEAGFDIETIFPFKDKLFIGSTSVVHIFSLEDPAHPKKISVAESKQVFRRCDPVVARENVAFATLRTSGPCGGT